MIVVTIKILLHKRFLVYYFSDGVFADKPGYYNVTLPIVLENNFEEPYQYITLAGELKAPRLWFDPLAVVLTAVPLDTDVTAEITILAENYSSLVSFSNLVVSAVLFPISIV